MKTSTLKGSGERHPRIGRVYLTGMIAAVPVAVAAIFAASPTTAPAQLSVDAAGQSAVLVEVAPPLAPCRWSGGDSAGVACPGSNKKKTRNSDQRTGSNGINGGGSGRYGGGGTDTSPGNTDTSNGCTSGCL